MDDARQILNLLHTYAERIDSGDLDGAASLFDHARIKLSDASGGIVDNRTLRATWEDFIAIHPDGTPRTKHVITNEIIEVNESGTRATCRSYYTVIQQTPTFPLQPICAGRYHDEFEKVDDVWRWSYRDYSLFDFVGDMSAHDKSTVSR